VGEGGRWWLAEWTLANVYKWCVRRGNLARCTGLAFLSARCIGKVAITLRYGSQLVFLLAKTVVPLCRIFLVFPVLSYLHHIQGTYGLLRVSHRTLFSHWTVGFC